MDFELFSIRYMKTLHLYFYKSLLLVLLLFSFLFQCIEDVLGKADYNHDSVNKWIAAIVERSLANLIKLGKTYKYIGKIYCEYTILFLCVKT